MDKPRNLSLFVTPSEQKITITWTWEYHTLSESSDHEPEVPTGFIVDRRIGNDNWAQVTDAVGGTERTYEDILSDADALRVLVGKETVFYRVKSYWIG